MTASVEAVVVGAGPYGLSAAVHLRRAGVGTRIFGDCMSFWREMPKGMFLRSNWSATHMVEPRGELGLAAYLADTDAVFATPVPLDDFIGYGRWVQRKAVPDLDPRFVARVDRNGAGFDVELDDGERLHAERVVVACGIERFARRLNEFAGLPAELVSHSGDHFDLSRFAGRRVAVIGGGQSALESAALMHESGAEVELFIRSERVVWLRGKGMKKRLGPLGPVVYAPTDVGPLWYSRLVAIPDVFRQLPRETQTRIARRSIRPAGSDWVRNRLDDVPLRFGSRVVSAAEYAGGLRLRLAGGGTREVDHLMQATGYQVDVARYPFLAPSLVAGLERVDGYPVLRRGLESSVPGLHFLGAPAAWSFGPICRFVSGSWYGGRSLAAVASEQRAGART